MKYFDYDAYLAQLEELVNVDGGSYDPEGVDKMSALMAAKYESLGLSVTRKRFDERAGTCLEVRTHPEDEDIDLLLVGHMDTVFPKGTVAERPFTTDGERAYGPGVIDMKPGLLSMFYLVQELVKTGSGLRLCVAMNTDEEISSRYSHPWISALARKAKCALVFEPGRKNGAMVDQRKGVAHFDVDLKGIAAHAGINPWDGASAVQEAAEWITRLVPLNDYDHGTSVNIGVIRGGMGSNTVAEQAHFEVDVRFTDMAVCDRVAAKLEEMRRNPFTKGVEAVVTPIGARPPMMPVDRTRTMEAAMEAEGAELGMEVKFVATGGGSDGNFIAFEGCPVLDAVGPVGDGAHSAREALELNTIGPRLELAYRAILRLEREGFFARK